MIPLQTIQRLRPPKNPPLCPTTPSMQPQRLQRERRIVEIVIRPIRTNGRAFPLDRRSNSHAPLQTNVTSRCLLRTREGWTTIVMESDVSRTPRSRLHLTSEAGLLSCHWSVSHDPREILVGRVGKRWASRGGTGCSAKVVCVDGCRYARLSQPEVSRRVVPLRIVSGEAQSAHAAISPAALPPGLLASDVSTEGGPLCCPSASTPPLVTS